jgi:hypothetical protein
MYSTNARGSPPAGSSRRARDPPTSPGCGLIEQVEDFLIGGTGPRKIQDIVVCKFDDFRDALSRLGSRFRIPLAQPGIQLFN